MVDFTVKDTSQIAQTGMRTKAIYEASREDLT